MPRTLFVVDDSATMRKVFELTFAGEDINVVTHEGSDGASQRAKESRPTVAIVDVNLGDGGSGYDVVRSIRAESGLGPIPIYLLYSEHAPLDEGAARGCGASGALAKPFDSQSIIDRVNAAMSAGAGAQPTPPTPTSPVTPPRPATPPLPRTAVPLPTAARPGPPTATRPAAVTSTATRPAIPALTRAAPPSAALDEAPDIEIEVEKPAPEPVAPSPPPASPSPVVAATAEVGALAQSMGLSPAQVDAITALTREVVERVVWEVVPSLAETMIREELKRLTAE